MSSNSITNLATPAAGTDAANKVYVDTALGGKLDKAGGTMTGDIDMSGNDLTNIQSLKTNTQGTLYIGVFSGAQESILTGGLTGGDRGLVWFNATTNKVRFWDGSSANSVASGTHSFNAPFVATPVGEDTQVSLDMGVGLTLNGSTLEADFGSLGAQFHQNSAIPNCTSGQKLQMSVGPPYNWSCVTDQTVPSGAAGGDLSGSYPNPTVYRIQNRVVSATAPTVDQVLKFNGAQWQPQNMNWLENGGNLYRAGGNVGIGTSTPGSKLEVSGTGHFTGDLTSDGKVGVGGAVDASIPLSVHGSGTNVIAVKGTSTTAGIRLESASSGTGNQIYVNDSNNLYIRTDGGIRMRVFDASGITQIEQLQINNDMDANSKKITNLADPTLSGDAANKDYVDQGNKFIGVRYTMSANRTISANVETTLNFDVADFDTDSLVTPGAGWVFTAPKAGYYRVATNIQVYDQLNAGEQMEIILYWQSGARNTNIAGRWGDINGSFPIMTGSTTVYMNAGQTAWLTVLHTQAPNIRVDGTDIYTFLSIDYAGN